MFRASALVGMALLGMALVVGTGTSGGAKKSRGQLPSGWKNLGLSQEQAVKIRAIDADYKDKISNLEKQIKELRIQQKTDMVKVLTPAQKDKLRKLTLGEGTKEESRKPKEK